MGKLAESLNSDEPNPLPGRPHLVSVLCDDEDRVAIVAAYREGRSAEWIAARSPVSTTAIRNWLISVGEWRGRNR